MGRHWLLGTIAATGLAVVLTGGTARAQQYSAALSGFDEVGGLNKETSAILTDGIGTLSLSIDKTTKTATYTLSYSHLTSPVIMAHIHFAKLSVPGGILVWLCQTKAAPSPTAGTPSCPAGGGKVSGMLTAKSVVSISGQNVKAGDFTAFVDALASDTAYVNVHTTKFGAGEIRGQVVASK
jgi:hypothetical protein